MDLVLFGIQGSGKGTQAKMLAKECGYEIFEAGGALRGIAASGSPLGKKVKSFIDIGELVPHEIIMDVVRQSIAARPGNQKILFDGIPRDSAQQADFDRIMAEAGREFRCIQFEVDMEACIQRILGRAAKEGRADDASEETIRKRMNTFLTKTMPVIDGYKKAGKMAVVNGDGTVEEVYERVKVMVEAMK